MRLEFHKDARSVDRVSVICHAIAFVALCTYVVALKPEASRQSRPCCECVRPSFADAMDCVATSTCYSTGKIIVSFRPSMIQVDIPKPENEFTMRICLCDIVLGAV